jgi:tetratricopeptide (TPR) repeat protein
MVRLSFVRDRGDGTFVLHDLAEELVRAEIGERLSALTTEASELLEKASIEQSDYTLLGLAISVQALADEPGALRKLDEFSDKLILKYETTNAMILFDAIRLDSAEGGITLDTLRAYVYALTGRVAEAEHLSSRAIEIAQNLVKNGSSDGMMYHGRATYLLARVYDLAYRHTESENLHREVLRIIDNIEEEPRGAHASWMLQDMKPTVLHFLGIGLSVCNRHAEAEKLLRESLDYWIAYVQRSDLEQNDPLKSMLHLTRNHLAYALYNSGKASESEELLWKVIETSDDPVNTLLAERFLGLILRGTTRSEEAKEVLGKCLASYKELAENDPECEPSMARIMTQLALLHFESGDYSEAEFLYRDALSILRRLQDEGKVHSHSIAWSLRHLGAVLADTGSPEEAKEAFQEAKLIYTELVKTSEAYLDGYAAVLNNLGVLLNRMNKHSGAEEAFREAYRISMKLSNEHPEAVLLASLHSKVAGNLSIFLGESGQQDEADELLDEASEIQKRLVDIAPEMYRHCAFDDFEFAF